MTPFDKDILLNSRLINGLSLKRISVSLIGNKLYNHH